MIGVTPGLVGQVGSNGGTAAPSGPSVAPVNTVAPVASGSTPVGSTLTTTDGTWTGTPPPSFTYQWKRDGATIVGAIISTYTTQAADVGTSVTCTVTATNVAGSASANSNGITPTASAPVNTVAPSVSGSAPVGSTLTSTTGTWTGTPTPTYAYQWKRDGVDIGGATASTYVTVVADTGAAITCTVTATNVAGSASAGSSNSVTPTDAALTALNLVLAGYASPPSSGSARWTAMYNFISALMATPAVAGTPGVSIWASRDRLCVYRCAEAQGARVNWITPGTGNSTVTGTGGTFTVDIGYSGASGSNYITFAASPSTDFVKGTRNDNSFGAATSTDANDVSSAAIAGSTLFSIQPRSSTGAIVTRNASTGVDTGSANTGIGLYTVSRNTGSAYNRYNRATLVDSPTRTSITITTAPMYVATNNIVNFSNKAVGLVHFGSFMDTAAVVAFDTAWQAYVAAL